MNGFEGATDPTQCSCKIMRKNHQKFSTIQLIVKAKNNIILMDKTAFHNIIQGWSYG